MDETVNLRFGNPEGLRAPTEIGEPEINTFKTNAAATSLLRSLYLSMQNKFPSLDGVGYGLSTDNTFPDKWLEQTPRVWGDSASSVKPGAGQFVADRIEEIIGAAESFIDITSLVPFPDGAFFTAIQNGLVRLMASGRKVIVRILVGWYELAGGDNQREYLEKLMSRLLGLNGDLTIYVGAQRTSPLVWNHAKIIAVDGKVLLTGGQNLWDANYLGPEPVHDLNVRIEGSAAFFAHKFIDRIWEEVCDYKLPNWRPAVFKSGPIPPARCLSNSAVPRSQGSGSVAVLGAGRYGDGKNPADTAMVLAFRSATTSIKISQQDLLFNRMSWDDGMDALAKALIKGVEVSVVISNDDGKASGDGNYSVSTVAKTARAFERWVKAQPDAPADVGRLLCEKLNLSTLRFGPDDRWPNGFEFANHAKFFMIDDKLFYVGSENLYPSDLIEYGVFVDDPALVEEMKVSYWDKLWRNSKRVAVSGKDAERCVFSE